MSSDKVAKDLEIAEVGREIKNLGDEFEAFRHDFNEMKDTFSQMMAIFEAGKGALTVMGWMGKAVKWLALVGGSIAALWYWLYGQK